MDYRVAKFAPVAPIQMLSHLYDYGPNMFGEYHLLLAHHVLEKKDEFAKLFQRIHVDGHIKPTIIMDNSIVELGSAAGSDTVEAACKIVRDNLPDAQLIAVLPDVMGDGRATRQALADSIDEWEADVECDSFMVVLQGKNDADFDAMLDFVKEHQDSELSRVGWLSVPRIRTKTAKTRWNDLEKITKVFGNDYNIHLLGFSDDVEDDIMCARHALVDGIDSAVPLRINALFEVPLNAEPRDPKWFDTGEVTTVTIENLIRARVEVAGMNDAVYNTESAEKVAEDLQPVIDLNMPEPPTSADGK